jgi:predicted RNase H-like HicB family nuclease
MSQTYTAVVKQSGAWWIGWIEEMPGVNCQERSREALLETLKITLEEALELSRREARDAAGDSFEEIKIAV